MGNPAQAQGQHHQQQLPPHSDNVQEELSRVQSALEVVFNFSNAAPEAAPHQHQQQWTRQLADQYLTSFQSTAVAWQVCDQILLSQQQQQNQSANNSSALFFAAQTLHTKCRRCGDVQQLPPSSLPSLRDSLVTHLSKQKDSTVTIRLAMAVAALSIQMCWHTIVTDLLALPPDQSHHWVQQVLQVLPEECASDRLLLEDENERFRMRDHLVVSAELLLKLASPNFALWHTWIRYVPIPPQIFCLPESTILGATFQALQSYDANGHALEPAMDVLVEILRMYPSHLPQNEQLLSTLLPHIIQHLPVEEALRKGGIEHDELVLAYCRMVTELGECYLRWMVEPPPQQRGSMEHHVRHILQWMLLCSQVVDTEVEDGMTLHFWYRFAMELETIECFRTRQTVVDMYTPYLLQLLDCLVGRHIQYPEEMEDLTYDHIDDLKRHRFYCSETLQDCCRLLGGQMVLDRAVGQRLSRKKNWQEVEATLYCLQSLHRYIPTDEAVVLPACMSMVPTLPQDLETLRFTASEMIGKYASWLAVHPEHLQPLLPYLAQGLQYPLCSTAAAIAIKELCSEDKITLGDSVLQLYQQVSLKLELKDDLEILEGACRSISRQPPNIAHEHMTRLVQDIGNRWTALLQDSHATAKQLMAEVERVTVLVRFLNVGEDQASSAAAILELMKSTWSLLEGTTKRFPRDTPLAENVCRLHKHALRTCGAAAYAPLFDSLRQALVESFAQSHQSPYLYAASICITEYGRNPAYVPRLFEMIEAMARTSFSFLQKLDDLVSHPDVVEELFYLMGRVMNYCPDPLVGSPWLLTALFQCAVVGMHLDHRDANKGTLNFLEAAVTFGTRHRNNANLMTTLQQQGAAVVSNLVGALMGDLPAYSVDSGSGSIAGILFQLNRLVPDLMRRQWLVQALQHAPERPRADFMSAFDGNTNENDFQVGIRAFQSACRRYRALKSGAR